MSEHNSCSPETAAGNKSVENGRTSDITDKKGYGLRWQFSPRHVDNLIAQGLPHLKIGRRRVRILVPEADAWMRQRFSQRRRPPARTSTTRASN
jgi:hypothetical protein